MIWLGALAHAGIGPTHTLVLVDGEDPDAMEVATAYAEARELPEGHVCAVSGVPDGDVIDLDAFREVRDVLEVCRAALPDPEAIDVLVTVRGLPYLVQLGEGQVGFEAALQVGAGTDPSGSAILGRDQLRLDDPPAFAASVPNPAYVGGFCEPRDLTLERGTGPAYRATCTLTREKRLPRTFRRSANHGLAGFDLSDELTIVARLDGFDYADARDLVDRGVQADGAFPTGAFLCMEGADPARGARDPECEFAIRKLEEIGANAEWVAPFDGALEGREVVAYFTGASILRDAIDGHTYAPGAIVDNLTSFGAVPRNFVCDDATCPANESQTSIARFVRAGATGVHGTVAEPLNNSFPDAAAMVLYHEGYSLGESFLYAQEYLYWFNLVLGDPLATPFAARPEVTIADPVAGEDLVVTATHPDGVGTLVLYVDDRVVARTEGDTLRWSHGAGAGEVLALRGVATAAPVLVGRPPYDTSTTPPMGWDQPDAEGQRVRPETQGWTVAELTVAEAPPPPEEGCGCRTSRPLAGLATPLIGLVLLRRRRR